MSEGWRVPARAPACEPSYGRALAELLAAHPGLLAAAAVRRILMLRTVPAPQALALARALTAGFPAAALTILTANPFPHPPEGWDVVGYPFGRSFDRGRTPATWYAALAAAASDLLVLPYADDTGLGYENVRLFAVPLLGALSLEVFGWSRTRLMTAATFREAAERAGDAPGRPTIVDRLPHYVTLNLTERCNLRCVMCDNPEAGGGDAMSFPQLTTVADQLLPACRALTLNGFLGEPLLHRDFVRIIGHIGAHWPQVSLTLATNATALTGARLEAMLCSRIVRELRISVNAVSAATYDAIMVGARHARTMRNIREFMLRRQERGLKGTLAVTFSFVALRQNIDELPDFVSWAAGLGADQVLVWECALSQARNAGLIPERARALARYDEARTRAERVGIAIALPPPYHGEGCREAPSRAPAAFRCNLPWTHAYVSPNGDVIPCCNLNRIMGNTLAQPFAAVWNGDPYRRLRREINAGHYPIACIGCPQNFDAPQQGPQEVLHRSRRLEG